MRQIDDFSYACGAMDCFNEIVNAGVKKLALGHPTLDRALRDEYIPVAEEICKKYGTKYYVEDVAFLTDLFPVSLNKGKYNLVFYKDDNVLKAYLALKGRKAQLVADGAYQGQARLEIAREFGYLLSYTDEAIYRLIANNAEKEVF